MYGETIAAVKQERYSNISIPVCTAMEKLISSIFLRFELPAIKSCINMNNNKLMNELALALIYLTAWKEKGDEVYRAWKGYDFNILHGKADVDIS